MDATRATGEVKQRLWLREFDARGAEDREYRLLLSSLGKRSLSKGETWRGRLVAWAEYEESKRAR